MTMWHRLAVAAMVVVGFAACAAPEIPEESKKSSTSKLEDRWQPPSSDATGTYEGLGGEGCAGGLKPGTQALGEQVKAQFGVSYGGYSCRANTGNTKELSIHAVGRALDVMVGQGSEKGNEIANYFVENATTLGIDLIIWNHTLWKVTPTGATSRAYTGPNPHTDHVHAEVTHAVAESGPGQVDAPTTDPNATDPNATDPNATDPNATDPNATDPNGDPYADDPYASDDQGPYSDESEVECYADTDCDPSGQLICDQGYCTL
jgi:hypothetical protein